MGVCDIKGDCGQGRSRKASALTRETEVESSMPNFLYVTGCLNISSPNGFLCPGIEPQSVMWYGPDPGIVSTRCILHNGLGARHSRREELGPQEFQGRVNGASALSLRANKPYSTLPK